MSLLKKLPIVDCMQIGKRAFGIEIESIVSRCNVHKNHFDLFSSLNLSSTNWNIIEDGSIETENEIKQMRYNNHIKFEIVSPKLEYNDLTMTNLENLCNDLEYKINANINQSCGFHIHFDAEDLTINDILKIAINYAYFEEIIDLFMDETRRNNNNKWIQSIQKPIYKNLNKYYDILRFNESLYKYNESSLTVLDLINPNRKNHKYNFTNLFYYNLNKKFKQIGNKNENKNKYINTIENRHHHSTFNYYDMINWIRFNLLFIYYSKHKPLFYQNFIKNDTKNDMVYIEPIDPFQKFDLLSQFIQDDDIINYYQRKI